MDSQNGDVVAFQMYVIARVVASHILVLALGSVVSPVYGQVDTTDAAPSDTVETVSADSVREDTTDVPRVDTTDAPRADTTGIPPQAQRAGGREDRPEVPSDPRSFTKPAYGRPPVDSLPALTSHVGLEHLLAEAPGSFLYDLGAVGWPHGWSVNGLAPHRSRLWLDDYDYTDPLTGRARFDLVPTSFLRRPTVGVDPGGSPMGVHASWRDYDQVRPITELRFRRDTNGLKAIEVGHSQKRRWSVFGVPGVLQATFGYGGRTTGGVYEGSDVRRERRIWGRLRYQRDEWAVEVTDFSSRHEVGAHGGVAPPPGAPFGQIFVLPICETCSQRRNARRQTFRNDLTVRLRAPLVPGLQEPLTVAGTWTSKTFDFATVAASSDTANTVQDTTWTARMHGGHGSLQQSVSVGAHDLRGEVRGSVWGFGWSNIPQLDGTRWNLHASARDSMRAAGTDLILDAGWHVTSGQQYPTASVQIARPVGPFHLSTSVSSSGQRSSWFETEGFLGFVEPLPRGTNGKVGRVLEGRAALASEPGPFDIRVEGFAHQLRNPADLYAGVPDQDQRVASTDTVRARRLSKSIQRAGLTVAAGWRRDARRGVYISGQGTALTTLNAEASLLHARLARTLPRIYGKGRIGARFVFFTELLTDLSLQARAWTVMNSRWFHPPTGRHVVPPFDAPLPMAPGAALGPTGTLDLRAEIKLRGATLFFTLENIQASFANPTESRWDRLQRQATLQAGTFVVPVYPLPARQFRFGVFWPIFD